MELDLNSWMTDPVIGNNPWPMYAGLRDFAPAVSAPFSRSRSGNVVILSRYEDVHRALRAPELYEANGANEMGQQRPVIPLDIDPPEHAKYRKLLDPLFSPRAVAAQADDTRAIAREMLAEVAEAGYADFHQAFTVPFPCRVFLKVVGFPADDLDLFLRWKDAFVHGEAVAGTGDLTVLRELWAATATDVYAYFDALLDRRIAEPADDLATRLVRAEIGENPLSRNEMLDILFLQMAAGLDTVTATLDCVLTRLARDLDLQKACRDEPERTRQIVEELLRIETPVSLVLRYATQVHGDARRADREGRPGHAVAGCGEHRRPRLRRPDDHRHPPRQLPPHGLRWRCPPVSRLAPGPPRAQSGTRRNLRYSRHIHHPRRPGGQLRPGYSHRGQPPARMDHCGSTRRAMTYRVAHGGTGLTGSEALRGIITDPALQLVGVLVTTSDKVGVDAGQLCGLPDTGVTATDHRDAIIAMKPDCFAYCATAVRRDEARYRDMSAAGAGSTSSPSPTIPMVYPPAAPDEWREPIESACREGGSTFYATGSEPGFASLNIPTALLAGAGSVDCYRMDEYALDLDLVYPIWDVLHESMGFGKPDGHVPIRIASGKVRTTGNRRALHRRHAAVRLWIPSIWTGKRCSPRPISTPHSGCSRGTICGHRWQLAAIIDGRPVVVGAVLRDRDHTPWPETWPRPAADTVSGLVYRVAGRPTCGCNCTSIPRPGRTG